MAGGKQLSLCIVAKNEEAYIFDCIQELKGIADEVIVADIGSTDRTAELARAARADTYKIRWNQNYSEAKNICLDHAKGRWVLFLEADETILPEQREELRELLGNPNAEGYVFQVDYSSPQYGIFPPSQSLRLLRNRAEYRYRYRSFPSLTEEMTSGVQNSFLSISHRGTEPSPWALKNSLLTQDLAEHPQDSYLLYRYGISLLNDNRQEESIPYFQKAIQNCDFACFYAPLIYKCLGWTYLFLEQYVEALAALSEGIENFPLSTDLLVLRGELFKQCKRFDRAIQDLKLAFHIREQNGTVLPSPEIDDSILLESLGEVYERFGSERQALLCYQQAYEFGDTSRDCLCKIGELAKETDSSAVMDNLLETILEQEDPTQLLLLIDIFFRQRQYDRVVRCSEYLEAFTGDSALAESIRVSCRLMLEEEPQDFPVPSKDNPYSGKITLARIKNAWFFDRWVRAYQLICGMAETDDTETVSLYRSVHFLLTENRQPERVLAPEQYEQAVQLYEDFLWLGQEQKAKILLPFLLEGKEDTVRIRLAEPWAERNRYEMIEEIYRMVSREENRVEFKKRVIAVLLRTEHVETALRVMNLGQTVPLQGLEQALWARSAMEDLGELLNRLRGMVTVTACEEPSAAPDESLLRFYKCLSKASGVKNAKAPKLTYAETQEKIGDLYLKAQKQSAALTAYLRALSTEPKSESVQKKICLFQKESPAKFPSDLRQACRAADEGRFGGEQGLFDYVWGLIAFFNRQYEKSESCFSKIPPEESGGEAALAFRMAALWLDGKKEEAERLLPAQGAGKQFPELFRRAYRAGVLCRLKENEEKYPYCEGILLEEQRVQGFSF